MGNITEVGDHNFAAEMGSVRLGLMYFWSPLSEPCKPMTLIVEEIARQFEGKLKVAKMNIKDYPSAVARWGVREVPHFLLWKDAAVPEEQIVGAVPKATLVSAIEKALL